MRDELLDATDYDLLHQAAASADAFVVFYRRYERLVAGWLMRRTGRPELVADLTAEVFAAAYLAAPRYRDGPEPAGAWLLGIARNKLLRSLRRERTEALSRRRLAVERIAITDESIASLEELRDHSRGAARARGSLPRLGGALAAVAAGAACVIAVLAIVVVGHNRSPSAGGGGGALSRRGEIVAADGTVLAASAQLLTIAIVPSELPATRGARVAEVQHLVRVLRAVPSVLRRAVDGCIRAASRCHLTTIASPGPLGLANYVRDHGALFPGVGVGVERAFRRVYPRGPLAAQPLGSRGLEREYDPYLAAGDTLRLALDPRLQSAGQQALQTSIVANAGVGGAFVAMNPDNGQIYAIGSLPTYDPHSGAPLINRAIDSTGPIGSVFTPITATAALQSRAWSIGATYDDTGQYCLPGGTGCLHNSGHVANGVLDLVNAIRVSDDVFFDDLGALTNAAHPGGGALQNWARLFGIGQPTGVDLPGEASGALPTPASRAARNTNRPWSAIDNINLAVGQGDLQATPLQVAVAYSAIANGGTVVRPHLGVAITAPDGSLVRAIQPAPVRRLDINPAYLSTIRQGLREAGRSPGGTSDNVMGSFPEPVYGTAGTAQYAGRPDYAWYAGFVPASATSKPIVVVVTVERGGFGAVAAAPVARQILSQWFLGRPGPYVRGTSHTL